MMNTPHIRRIKVATAAIASALMLFTQSYNAAAQSGTEAMGFALVARSPEAAGMGFGGAASLGTPAWAAFTNPAALPFSGKTLSAGLSYQSLSPQNAGSDNFAAGVSGKLGKVSLSVGLAYGLGEEITGYDATGVSTGTFRPSDSEVAIGIGYAFSQRLSAGLNVKYLGTSLSEDADYAAGAADAFILGRFGDFTATAGVSNVGGTIKGADGADYDLPTSATMAGSFARSFGEAHTLELLMDGELYFSGAFAAAVGAQYSLYGTLCLRAGYHAATDDAALPSFATVGLGLNFLNFSLNAAYLFGNDDLTDSFTIGIGYAF